MTVSNQTCRTSAVGSGSAGQEIPFLFPITDTSDLVVKTRVTATGAESAPLTETSDYTITGDESGGTVTLVAAVAATSEIFVIRDTPKTQELDLVSGGSFDAEEIEDAFDKADKIDVEHDDDISRCLRAPVTDDPDLDLEIPNSVERASKFLTFDSDGLPTATDALSVGLVSFGAFGTSVAATASEAAFKTLANLEAGIDYQAYSTHLAALVSASKTDSNFVVANGTTWVAETADTALTSLGFTTFTKTIIDDTTAAAVRTTISALGASDVSIILCYEGAVVAWEEEVLTWQT